MDNAYTHKEVCKQNAVSKQLNEETLQDRIDRLEWSIACDKKELRSLKILRRTNNLYALKNDELAVKALEDEHR